MKKCLVCGITDNDPKVNLYSCFHSQAHNFVNMEIWEAQNKAYLIMEQPEKPRIPEFFDLLEQMKAIHVKKNADYASESSPFSNFKRAAIISDWFTDPVDKVFATLIGVKLARLAELLQFGRISNNESTDDSFLDVTTYMALWASYRKRNK